MKNSSSGLRLAKKQARRSKYIYRLGAVIMKGKRVLSTGYNKICHCKENIYPDSRHAEMDAIIKLLDKYDGLSSLAGASLYVTRITNTNKTSMAKPCQRCMELIQSVGIKQIIFTTHTGVDRIKL